MEPKITVHYMDGNKAEIVDSCLNYKIMKNLLYIKDIFGLTIIPLENVRCIEVSDLSEVKHPLDIGEL